MYWFDLGVAGFRAAVAAGFCLYAALLVYAVLRVSPPEPAARRADGLSPCPLRARAPTTIATLRGRKQPSASQSSESQNAKSERVPTDELLMHIRVVGQALLFSSE